ncbi:hypothetical protein ACFL5H_00280 [Candidatus Latescibacterota bacterium]
MDPIRYKTTERLRTQNFKGTEIPEVQYEQQGCHAVIICPFCSKHFGKTVRHYHGVVDRLRPWKGEGLRAPHCDTLELELILPDGVVLRNINGYFLVYQDDRKG